MQIKNCYTLFPRNEWDRDIYISFIFTFSSTHLEKDVMIK